MIFYIGAIVGIKLRTTEYIANNIRNIQRNFKLKIGDLKRFSKTTLRKSSMYSAIAISKSTTINAFWRSESRMSPFISAITALVSPQPGQ